MVSSSKKVGPPVSHNQNSRFLTVPAIVVSIALCFGTVSEVASQKLNEGISQFALDLYQECAAASIDQNIIISPYSVASALVLLSQGAQHDTFDQISHALHLESNKTAIAAEFAANNKNLLSESVGQSTLSIANQLYVHQNYQIRQTFRDVAVNQLKSGVESLDFANSMAAAQVINSFVENKTNHKIKDLFDSNSFDSDTRLVIVNAIYFKGLWKNKFSKSITAPGDFYVDETQVVSVDYMRNIAHYRYAQLDDLNASALELQYANSNISFVAVLPNSRSGLSALEASLVNYQPFQITGRMYDNNVDLKLPKFKVEYKIKLNAVLKKLGMTKMFESSADLGGLLDPSTNIQVSEVVHKAFIEVNEEGSEAAAATGLGIAYVSKPLPPIQFHADHPFLYYILDRNTNSVLFSGRCKHFN